MFIEIELDDKETGIVNVNKIVAVTRGIHTDNNPISIRVPNRTYYTRIVLENNDSILCREPLKSVIDKINKALKISTDQ